MLEKHVLGDRWMHAPLLQCNWSDWQRTGPGSMNIPLTSCLSLCVEIWTQLGGLCMGVKFNFVCVLMPSCSDSKLTPPSTFHPCHPHCDLWHRRLQGWTILHHHVTLNLHSPSPLVTFPYWPSSIVVMLKHYRDRHISHLGYTLHGHAYLLTWSSSHSELCTFPSCPLVWVSCTSSHGAALAILIWWGLQYALSCLISTMRLPLIHAAPCQSYRLRSCTNWRHSYPCRTITIWFTKKKSTFKLNLP